MRRHPELTQPTDLHPFNATLKTREGPARSKNEPALHTFRDQFAAVQADLVSDVYNIAQAGLGPFADSQVLHLETFWHLSVVAGWFLDRHLPILLPPH
jgi:hypothetical protein